MSRRLARLGAAAAAGIIALIVVTIAICYLADALLAAFEAVPLSPAVAALLVGVVGLVLAAVIALIVRLLVRAPRAAAVPAPPGGGLDEAAAQLGGLVAQQLVSTARARPYTTMAAALAAGLALGVFPELRSILTGRGTKDTK